MSAVSRKSVINLKLHTQYHKSVCVFFWDIDMQNPLLRKQLAGSCNGSAH